MQDLVTDRAYFKSIIESNSLYIDKTEFVYKIASSEEKFFLLNRPRRFGKSLFVNTLKSFYQGDPRSRLLCSQKTQDKFFHQSQHH
ncbi:putative AAA-ATPase [Halanaerobium saccharolyticum]|uniref:Putative AAA-ATPase n=1 Tax=Halanaerobium saccharolyticum TaxID=43595 RepID=A0A4R6LYU9_9FIRM|nr:putative AAA-ATPase [Halanaerobium saccharolyticum]